MDKIGAIFHLLSRIDMDYDRIADEYESLLRSIDNYIDSVSYLKKSVIVNFSKRRDELSFEDFEVRVEIETRLKLVNIDTNPSYCMEVNFVTEQERNKKESIYKAYITSDGYIVDGFTSAKPICESDNTYKGKILFERLLINLADKKIISV